MPKVAAQNGSIYYEVWGDGPPLLLIMGLGGSRLGWGDAFLEPMQRLFTTVLVDNRGTGRSDKPQGLVSIDDMAHDALAVLDDAGLERVHVFGVSMGGAIAQRLVLNAPQRVNRLALGCTFCSGETMVMPEEEVVNYLFSPTGTGGLEAAMRGLRATYTPAFLESQRELLEARMKRLASEPTPPYVHTAQLRALRDTHNACDELGSVVAPTLILTGACDQLVPPQNSDVLAQHIPNATLHTISDAAHTFWVSHPQETVDTLTSFLNKE